MRVSYGSNDDAIVLLVTTGNTTSNRRCSSSLNKLGNCDCERLLDAYTETT